MLILAGDKDYLPLIWFLRSKGCKVEIASFAQAAADVVKQAADRYFKLSARHTVNLARTRNLARSAQR